MPARDVAERERDALGDVGLAALGGAERHRRRRVEHEPGDEHALGELDAHVRLARARGHVPVDVADVVLARHVRANLRELACPDRDMGTVVARQQALDAAHEVRSSARRSCPAAGPGLAAPACALRSSALGGAAHATRSLPRSSCGTGTAAMISSSSESGLPLLGQRLVGEHEPVAERVLHELLDVADERVVAPAEDRERPRALRDGDRPARARAEGDVVGELRQTDVAGSRVAVASVDGVADQARIDVRCRARSAAGASRSSRDSACSSSGWATS